MTFSLGIDIGTSGVKTATLNAEYEIFSTSNIKHINKILIRLILLTGGKQSNTQ